MCGVIRAVSKPCLAFKILAAGRKAVQPGGVHEAFAYVLSHIKPTDGVVVGMFPKYSNQIEENARLVRKICDNTIIKIESGKNKNPITKTLAKLAETLGAPLDDLVKGKNKKS